MAWFRGLKTTYYLRALGATSVEKSTVDRGNLNAVGNGSEPAPKPEAAPAPTPSEPRGIEDFLSGKSGSGSRAPSAGEIDELGCEACQ
jgi:ribonucleoside-diphosphate reductase alpha chain